LISTTVTSDSPSETVINKETASCFHSYVITKTAASHYFLSMAKDAPQEKFFNSGTLCFIQNLRTVTLFAVKKQRIPGKEWSSSF
jgi:hypothetical protein